MKCPYCKHEDSEDLGPYVRGDKCPACGALELPMREVVEGYVDEEPGSGVILVLTPSSKVLAGALLRRDLRGKKVRVTIEVVGETVWKGKIN